jgi:hypothetical protein
MSDAVRPIHVPGAAAFDWLRERVRAALDAWAREWVGGWTPEQARLATVHVGPVGGSAAEPVAGGYVLLQSATGCMWVSRATAIECARAVVGAELMPRSVCADEWIEKITHDAWEQRNRALCAALLGAPTGEARATHPGELPRELFAFGSGAIEVCCVALGVHAFADAAVWRAVPPPPRDPARRLPALTPIDRAMHGARARVEVRLGVVEVELPKILALRCGDVLRLPQRLDRGIAVLCAGTQLAQAMLGETRGHKGIKVFTTQPATNCEVTS